MTSLQTLEIETAETLIRLFILLLLIVVVAFFVAAELAIVSASKTEIAHLASQADHPGQQQTAQLVQDAQNHLDRFLSVTQTGTTAGSLLLGWLGEGATVHWIEPWLQWLPLGQLPIAITVHMIASAIAFLFITYIEIALGELIPKVLASQAPEKTALLLIRPLQFCYYLFFPALIVLNGTVRLLTGWVTKRNAANEPNQSHPFIQKDDHSMLISGETDIQTINEKLRLTLPANEAYRTLAGFMIYQLGRVPASSDRVQWDEFELEAVRVVESRLELILLRRITLPLVEVQEEPMVSSS